MKMLVRARLFFPLTIAAALGIWVACGGSDAQDVTIGDAGGRVDTGAQVIVPPPPPPEDAATGDSGRRPFPDAGQPTTLDGGDAGGIPCYEGGELELEPNNTKELANVLRRIRCGATRGESGPGSADPDVMTFTLVDGSAPNFDLDFQGEVKIVVETDGSAPVDISQPGASLGATKFNQPYYATITSRDGKLQKWVLILTPRN
jgi:hypothetical protein